nr:trna 2'-phosphotransferase 1 [Quercus suber]
MTYTRQGSPQRSPAARQPCHHDSRTGVPLRLVSESTVEIPCSNSTASAHPDTERLSMTSSLTGLSRLSTVLKITVHDWLKKLLFCRSRATTRGQHAGQMPGSSKPHGRPREPASRSTQVSKKLSWLLRHGAEKENLSLGPGGYANLADVLANRNLRSFKVTFDEIRTIVADNDKQRYQLILASDLTTHNPDLSQSTIPEPQAQNSLPPSDPALWLIRATQGHSLKLQEEADPSHSLLTPLLLSAPDDLPQVAVHGTTRRAWPLILATGGLKPMGRNHVHFATGVPQGFTSLGGAAISSSQQPQDASEEQPEVALPVISGMRNTSTILIFLDLRKALEAGIRFGMSANGVILSEGNADRVVPVKFFTKVEDWRVGKVLVENGVVLEQKKEK